jgi:hypothetical protein
VFFDSHPVFPNSYFASILDLANYVLLGGFALVRDFGVIMGWYLVLGLVGPRQQARPGFSI